jgi:hypothetical protein
MVSIMDEAMLLRRRWQGPTKSSTSRAGPPAAQLRRRTTPRVLRDIGWGYNTPP